MTHWLDSQYMSCCCLRGVELLLSARCLSCCCLRGNEVFVPVAILIFPCYPSCLWFDKHHDCVLFTSACWAGFVKTENVLIQDEEAEGTAPADDQSNLDVPAPNGTALGLADNAQDAPPGLAPGQL